MIRLIERYVFESTKAPWIFSGLLATLLLISAFSATLWDQDESAYAGMALNMTRSGNWTMPEFDWGDVHRKPPLHLWNIALSYQIFGINHFSTRISSILCVLLCVVLSYKIGRRFTDGETALTAMLLTGTSFLIPMLGRIALTDATLLCFVTLFAYAVLQQLTTPAWYWILLAWISFGLAALTKGPPIILFAGSFGLLLLIFYPDRKKLIAFHPWFFAPVALLPLALWGYLTYQEDRGRLLQWMYEFYVSKRFTGSHFGQTGPPGTHAFIILFSFLPYLAAVPSAVRFTGKKLRQKDPYTLMLLCWLIAAWIPYEISPSKLPSYTLAAHIPFALLLATNYQAEVHFPVWKTIVMVLNILFAIALFSLPFILSLPAFPQIALPISAVLYLLTLVAVNKKWAGPSILKNAILTGVSFQILLSVLILPAIEAIKLNTYGVAEKVTVPEQSMLYLANDIGKPPSLPFYLKKNNWQICHTFYVKDWVEAFYRDPNGVLILKDHQVKTVLPFLTNPTIDSVQSFNPEGGKYFHYYLIRNTQSNTRYPLIPTVQEPIKPLSADSHLVRIRMNPDNLNLLLEKAKERNISLDSMQKMDAQYLHEYETEIFNYEHQIRQSPQWVIALSEKAKEKEMRLETILYEEAKKIIELRNIP